jgi:hypothetical protein
MGGFGPCSCHSCQRSREMHAIMDDGQVDKMREAINYLLNEVCQIEADCNLAELRLKGEWPIVDREGGC